MGDTENTRQRIDLDDFEEPDIFGPSFPVGDHDRDIDEDAIWRPDAGDVHADRSPEQSPPTGTHN